MACVSIESELRKSDQGTERRFWLKQLCDEGLLGNQSGLDFGDVDSQSGQSVSQNLLTSEEEAPYAIPFAACFSGAGPILVE